MTGQRQGQGAAAGAVGRALDQFRVAVQHHQANRLEPAAAAYRAALAIKPDLVEAQVNLGAALKGLGRFDEAAQAFRRGLALRPGEAAVHAQLGDVLRAQSQWADALTAYRRATELKADLVDARYGEGVVLQALGRFDEAAAAYRSLLVLQPALAPVHYNLALALQRSGRLEEAAGAYHSAIALQPGYADAHYNLGALYASQGRRAEAAEAYGRVVQLRPDHVAAHNNLGVVLKAMGRLDEAAASFERAVGLKPDFAEAHYNLGAVLQMLDRMEAAVAAYHQALALRPDYAEAHAALGAAFHVLGRPRDADAAFRQSLALKPDLAEADSSWLLSLLYDPDVSPEQLLAEHRGWEARRGPQPPPAPYTASRDPERRLRIGYVSADFRSHPVSAFLLKAMAAHDPAAVEVFCYSNSAVVDDITVRLRGMASGWRSLVGVADDAAAAMIRHDEIDILVDLAGHSGHNRLPLFLLRPAPVQVSWIGYPASTGVSAIDYFISDAASTPPGAERLFSEAVVRLPYGRFCYAAPEFSPEVAARPEAGAVTFGSFNNTTKVGPGVVRLWAAVLDATPGSRLVLKWRSLADPAVRRRLEAAFAAEGLAADRLELRGASPHAEMLAQYADIDVALDPFPFCGGQTSCEALWMGRPVVTLPGERTASRQTLGFLRAIGLNELVAASEQAYVDIAVALANDPARRQALSGSLRERMAASALCDGARFTPTLEAAYRQMWRRWSAGEGAAGFDVPAAVAGS